MDGLRTIMVVALLCCFRSSLGGIVGRSGLVLHLDRYGHPIGHSTHFDYRFYPEEVPFLHIDDAEMQEAFRLIEDDGHYHPLLHHHHCGH